MQKIENWNPLYTRIISHRLGDGTFNFYEHAVWDNNRPEYFIGLCKHLDIKLWKPTKSGNTTKIIIPDYIFENYAQKYFLDSYLLKSNPVYLANSILNCLSEDDKIQTLCACFFDDGSCRSWRPVLFEDQKLDLTEVVLEIWNSVFVNGAKIDNKTITKAGTRIYHIVLTRDAFVEFYKKVKNCKNRLGEFAGFWGKELDVESRYKKASNTRALILNETKNQKELRKSIVLDSIKLRDLKFNDIQSILGISRDRCRLIVNELMKTNKIKLSGKTHKACYKLNKELQ